MRRLQEVSSFYIHEVPKQIQRSCFVSIYFICLKFSAPTLWKNFIVQISFKLLKMNFVQSRPWETFHKEDCSRIHHANMAIPTATDTVDKIFSLSGLFYPRPFRTGTYVFVNSYSKDYCYPFVFVGYRPWKEKTASFAFSASSWKLYTWEEICRRCADACVFKWQS